MAHVNICLNHIKNIGYTTYFTEEQSKLSSFKVIDSEEMVELQLVNKNNKKIDRIVTFKFIEDVINTNIVDSQPKIEKKIEISPNVEQFRSKQKTNIITETPFIEPAKMEKEESKILDNTKKINKVLFAILDDLEDGEIGAITPIINRAKAAAQVSQVILNSAKIEMEYLKRFGGKK